MTAPMINLFIEAILLYVKLCNMFRFYGVNYVLNESQVKLKNTNFVNKMLQRNQFLNERIWIIRYFQTHCQLSKLRI